MDGDDVGFRVLLRLVLTIASYEILFGDVARPIFSSQSREDTANFTTYVSRRRLGGYFKE